MNQLFLQKWHPRHWLLPLGIMGTSIMLVFILNIFVPHKGYFLPSITQVDSFIEQSNFFAALAINLTWWLFWALLAIATILIPYFLYKSIQFLKSGAHQISDKNAMETAGWFGVSLTLAMFGNVTSFATVMFFELNAKADDFIWPFWLAYNTAIALMALFQYIWYRQAKQQADQPEQSSMVVPFALGFMGLNLAGPGAMGSHDVVVSISIFLSIGFMLLSMYAWLTKLATFKKDSKALFAYKNDNTDATKTKNWSQLMNFGTAVTTFNVWLITSVRNYLNYGHHFSEFELATKNMITWGAAITVPIALLVLFLLWKRGFFAHLFKAQQPLVFSLGLICMLVSSYVITALYTMTALKLGLIAKGSGIIYLLIGVETILLSVTVFSVIALIYRMIIKQNVQCWKNEEVQQHLTRS
ncbi:TsoY family (seleno)protein [Thiomicrorhabdus sp.]|uniref:TsoY family (seleno)protein n=1 Tax=Thiomicrorhabdus sp. TaxID=2039724 RepID=UPI002AA80B44|nr:hypothetical protein [Thiomicrorhabdus sp.]